MRPYDRLDFQSRQPISRGGRAMILGTEPANKSARYMVKAGGCDPDCHCNSDSCSCDSHCGCDGQCSCERYHCSCDDQRAECMCDFVRCHGH